MSFSSIAEVQQGLKEGRAVAVYWTASTWIQDVATNKPMYTVEISNEEVAKLNELLPGGGLCLRRWKKESLASPPAEIRWLFLSACMCGKAWMRKSSTT